MHFQAKLVKYQRMHIIETTACIDSNQILHNDKYHQILVMGDPNMHITNPRRRTTAILKKKRKIAISATV